MSKDNGAILSEDALYRYALWRTVSTAHSGGEKLVGYIGVNPSTADHTLDDATVRKWRGFTGRMGYNKFVVANLFAYRATDVNELKQIEDPIGNMCDHYINLLIERCDILIPCWGNKSKLPKTLQYRIPQVEGMLMASGKEVLCFGKTQSGCPKHPLMLGYDTEVVPYFEGQDYE